MRSSEIRIRDPFVVPVEAEKRYYLYGTTDSSCWDGPGEGFAAYASSDLKEWEGPFVVFRPPDGFWATKNFWAPEVHRCQDRYFMFASFKADGVRRGTQILVADSPRGPFTTHSDGPVTPRDWECLDGTLFVDEEKAPWIVFCHEWVQVHDGEICAQRLSEDLRKPLGEPALLFRASQAAWAHKAPGQKDFVTDGPFMYRADSGELLMLWSSFGKQGYAIGTARSKSGGIAGPWIQDPEPLYAKDGGHGMVFRRFDGQLVLTIHTPNKSPNERPIFLQIEDVVGRLRLTGQ